MSSTRPSQKTAEQRDADDSSRRVALAGTQLFRGIVSLVLLVVLVVALLLAIPGLHGVARRVTGMPPGWLIVAGLLEILSCASYILAFLQVFERAPRRLGARVALSELAFGAAVSLGGAGSAAVGTWLLVERGGDPIRVTERSAVLFLLTSAVNVLTLALAGLGLWTGILPGPKNFLLGLGPAIVGIAVTVFVLLLPRYAETLCRRSRSRRVQTLLKQTADTVRDTRGYLFSTDWRIVGAIGYLWFDIAALGACFAAAGPVPPLSSLVLAYQIGYLANLVPIPGNIGVLDGSLVGMYVLYGVSATTATAATIVYHAISLWIPAVWGTVAFLVLRRSRGEPLRLRPPRAERKRLREAQRAGNAG